jgi:hypothetical protein
VKAGAKGIGELKYHVEADGPEMRRIYDLCAELNVPVLIHFQEVSQAAAAGGYNTGIKRFAAVLKAYPKTKFIAHADAFWANISADYREDTAYPSGPVGLHMIFQLADALGAGLHRCAQNLLGVGPGHVMAHHVTREHAGICGGKRRHFRLRPVARQQAGGGDACALLVGDVQRPIAPHVEMHVDHRRAPVRHRGLCLRQCGRARDGTHPRQYRTPIHPCSPCCRRQV